MPNIANLAHRIKPISIYSYLDYITVWVAQPLSHRQITELRFQCDAGNLHVWERQAKYHPKMKQRLQLRQPTHRALEILARRNDTHLNYAEFALDLIFEDEDELEYATWFIKRYHRKLHHGKQEIRYYKTTRYTGPRTARNVMVNYSDRASKVTGEPNTLHLEWRIRRPHALKSAGIHSVRELINFDHRQFWDRRLRFADIDRVKLGRTYRRHYEPHKSRPEVILQYRNFRYDVDERMGKHIVHVLGSTQAVLDQYHHQHRFDLRHALIDIEVDHLLPVNGRSTENMRFEDVPMKSRSDHAVLQCVI